MTDLPVRLRLSRKRGFDLQAASRAINGLPAVNVSRPGPWGNPFRITKEHGAAEAVDDFRAYVRSRLTSGVGYPLAALRGKNLACWCPLIDAHGKAVPCHATVLLELANAPAIAPVRIIPAEVPDG